MDCSSLRIATKHSYKCVHRWPVRRRRAPVDEGYIAASVQHHITAELAEVRTRPGRQASVPEPPCVRP